MQGKAYRRRLILGAGLALPAVARAQGWPDRPVRILVGFPPGGPTDILARIVATGLATAWEARVVVENRPGANATLAAEAVARAPADGHALLFTGNNIAMNAAVYRPPYDVARDFVPLGRIAHTANVLWAGAGSPFRTLAEVVAAARAAPGSLGYASTGNGGNGHFGGETLQRALGIRLTHVPYRGTAPALADVQAGRVPLLMQTISGGYTPFQAGQLRPIVAFGRRRTPELPETPTLAELGHDVPDSGGWYALLAPAGLPAPLLARLARGLEQVVQAPAFATQLATLATQPDWLPPEPFAIQLRQELAAWAAVARAAGMQPD